MHKNRITLAEAIKFHGHLGPYLVLGVLAGEFAVKRLKAKKYFGLEVKVWGATRKPKSCLIDGLQLSTGATYGKGNIEKFAGPMVKIEFRDCLNKKRMIVRLKEDIIQKIEEAKTHSESELLARKLYKKPGSELFLTA